LWRAKQWWWWLALAAAGWRFWGGGGEGSGNRRTLRGWSAYSQSLEKLGRLKMGGFIWAIFRLASCHVLFWFLATACFPCFRKEKWSAILLRTLALAYGEFKVQFNVQA
jgi:hypothetical protein